jgi:hypothetical protein
MFWKLFNLEQAPQPKTYENTNEWNLWFIDVSLKMDALNFKYFYSYKKRGNKRRKLPL